MNKSIRNFCIIAHIDHGKSTLADRMLEFTGTIEKRQMRDRILDQMDLEQERGITIKLQPVRMIYQDTILNMIDTPGHVDFNYEVSRSLASVEGALLLIDATQGIEAQTLSTLYQAIEQNLTIIPIVNKIDLPAANPEKVKNEIIKLLDIPDNEIIYASGKTGEGIEEILQAIIKRIPPPEDKNLTIPRLLVFDSKYDHYRGVVAYVRVQDGQIKPKEKIKMMQSKGEETIIDVGYFNPKMISSDQLTTGEIGYVVTNFKDISQVMVGDTMTLANLKEEVQPLVGFHQIQSNVFASIYPIDADRYPQLKDSLEKLKLNDAALSFEMENSTALGLGFRCGFLGLLHLEIIKERLEREFFNLEVLTTTPSVNYRIKLNDGTEKMIYSATDLPSPDKVRIISEPITSYEVITPELYLGRVIELINYSRGSITNTNYFNSDRVLIEGSIPLSEVITSFFDHLKSLSQGYASISYQFAEFKSADLVRMDILVNGEEIKPLSRIIPKSTSFEESRRIIEKLKELIPKNSFPIPIQAVINGKIIARETISAFRKDVIEKLYGGDVTRKLKLLEKQKKGKKRLAQFGKISIPTEVFVNLFH